MTVILVWNIVTVSNLSCLKGGKNKKDKANEKTKEKKGRSLFPDIVEPQDLSWSLKIFSRSVWMGEHEYKKYHDGLVFWFVKSGVLFL